MPAYLHHIETIVPEHAYSQAEIGRRIADQYAGDRKLQRFVQQLYRRSAIETRYSVIGDLKPYAASGIFFEPESGSFKMPTTGERNSHYTDAAKRLYATLARRTVAATPGFEPADVTHVITASCTGFFAPGPDYVVSRALSLHPATSRFHLGFMGCYAALPALRLAQAICLADERAVVLVACLELCTLHLRLDREVDNLIASAVFADGGAAALVTARERRGLRLRGFASSLTKNGEGDMAWTIGDHGFEMTLSSYVPSIVEGNVADAVAPLFGDLGARPQDIDRWAIHPGGRAILDKVAGGLRLEEGQMAASRRVLRSYGNMSSASVLFVLRDLLDGGLEPGEHVAALAFGPGLTVESALMDAA